MRHRLSGEYASVGNLKIDWGRDGVRAYLGLSLSAFFIASVQAGRHGHCDSNCLKGASIATMVSQGEMVIPVIS
ncbi:hypothetical protein CWO23_05860 [Vibrio splendidus]|nr:hypothetical protein CWO23_05860 [Vibrio splendidus]